MSDERRLIIAAVAGLVVAVLVLAYRRGDGSRLGPREAFAGGVTGGVLALLALVVVDP